MSPAHVRPAHEHDDVDALEAAVLDRLRGETGRLTPARRAVVHALFHGPDHHVTADDIAHAVQREAPDVHLSSVYRTLDALEDLGVVQRVDLGGGGAVFHLVDHEHHHLVCDHCGSVTEIPAAALDPLLRDLRATYGFAVVNRHVALHGRCRAC